MLSTFFFIATPSTEIYTLSLHDALPILGLFDGQFKSGGRVFEPGQREHRYRRRFWPIQAGRSGTWDVCGFEDRKSTRLNSSHTVISYAVFCLKKKKKDRDPTVRRRSSAI